jgi:hypothetical protein
MAERAGFEPAVPCGTLHFQCSTIGHSVTSPQKVVASFHADEALSRQRSKVKARTQGSDKFVFYFKHCFLRFACFARFVRNSRI